MNWLSGHLLKCWLLVLQLEEDWHDEKLMGALTQVCQILPRHPADAPSSAPGILARWRQRAGLSVSSEAGPRNAAWEVGTHISERSPHPILLKDPSTC